MLAPTSRPVCYCPVLSSLHSSFVSLIFGWADICLACVDEGAGILLRGGFWDAGMAPSSYCPVSTARLAFCQPASVELCILHRGASSVMSHYAWVSCEISELALTVAWPKVKVSTSHPQLPYPSPKNRDHSRAHIQNKPGSLVLSLNHLFLHFKNWHLGWCD